MTTDRRPRTTENGNYHRSMVIGQCLPAEAPPDRTGRGGAGGVISGTRLVQLKRLNYNL